MCKSDPEVRQLRPGNICRQIFPEQGDESFWYASDCVYRVRCTICGECYTGETKNDVQSRMQQHNNQRGTNLPEKSALTLHYEEVHPGQALMCLEMVDIIKTKGYVNRKITESVVAQTRSSNINRRDEGGQVVGELFLPEGFEFGDFIGN